MSTNTKRKGAKLPKGLPPLPPVPEGYDAWEYMGTVWSIRGPVGAPWGVTTGSMDQDGWYGRGTGKIFGTNESVMAINRNNHYIRAIKHPAPKLAKKAAVKAVRLWSCAELEPTPVFSRKRILPKDRAYAVLDVSNEAALIKQVGILMDTEDGTGAGFDHHAETVLLGLGIIAKRAITKLPIGIITKRKAKK